MFKLRAEPTFNAVVDFPMHGGKTVPVELTFKHRTKSELDVWKTSGEGKSEVDIFMECVVGWSIEEEFTRENVAILLENFVSVSFAVWAAYAKELLNARAKN